jgi:hypothetical protein
MPIVIAVVLLIGSSVLGAAVGYPLLVTLAMVIATTVWVHSDSDEIDYPDSAIEAKVLLFWIVYFPFYLYRRRELKIANAVSARLSEEMESDMRMSNGASPATRSASSSPSERACPECGETVLAVARKCKHCGSAIEPIVTEAEPATESSISSAQSAPTAASGPVGARLGRSMETNIDEVEAKSSRKSFFGVAAAVIALGAFLWFASTYNGSDPAVEALNSATQTAPDGAVGQPLTTPKFGILVTQVDTPVQVGNALMQESPAEGGSYVAIQWEYRNNSSNPIGIFSQPTVHLEDPSGTRYDPDVGASSAYAMQLELTEKAISNLNPGIKVRAGAVFEIASAELERPGWMIVVDADRNVRMPLFGKPEPEPEPASVAESDAPAAEEAILEEAIADEDLQAAIEEPAPTTEQIEQNRAIRQVVLDGAGPPGEYPRFSDYPAAEIYQGPPATLDMTSELARTFETRFGDGLAAEVSTAGEYVFVSFGCGTSCVVGAFVNKRTGQVVEEMLGGETGPQLVGRDVHSNLVIAEGPDENELGNFAFFYELKDSKLRLFKTVPIPPSLEEE